MKLRYNATGSAKLTLIMALLVGIAAGVLISNYTIIGDTVNIGQRLEQLGKEIYAHDNEVSILISSDTADKLDGNFKTVQGKWLQSIKGYHATIQ